MPLMAAGLVDRVQVTLFPVITGQTGEPGLFTPQRVGGEWLVDGGVHSVTNVDVTPFADVDEGWVVAPMAGAVFRHFTTSAMHNRIGASLRRELRSVPNGMRVRLFEPGHEASQAMGIALMSKDRSAATVLAGFLETGDVIATDVASRSVGSCH
jgi:predicted acylesterase/phospholipase RssA